MEPAVIIIGKPVVIEARCWNGVIRKMAVGSLSILILATLGGASSWGLTPHQGIHNGVTQAFAEIAIAAFAGFILSQILALMTRKKEEERSRAELYEELTDGVELGNLKHDENVVKALSFNRESLTQATKVARLVLFVLFILTAMASGYDITYALLSGFSISLALTGLTEFVNENLSRQETLKILADVNNAVKGLQGPEAANLRENAANIQKALGG